MQLIVFKREVSVLFDAAKIENVQYLGEKIQPIIMIYQKNPGKKFA